MTKTKAVAHFERTGVILPGHHGEIAAYIVNHAEELVDDE